MAFLDIFKKKKENIIDTLSVNVLLDSGRIQVLPFVTSVDRYKMVVGGSQDLDMNLDYHVSILKSPLPFKAGVNIRGNIQKVDIGITTAKLKNMATDKAQLVNDSIAKRLRNVVLRDSYVMSGLVVPEKLRKIIGNTDEHSNFSIQIKSDEETEDARRDAEMARRMQQNGGVVVPADTVVGAKVGASVDTTKQVAPVDSVPNGDLTASKE